ncbi:GNAT family N-acetyltransferase [Novosphingobium colocasiae]|uniref:N-acetyltransferase n=1 Tax=Novosphingobium colocasiae TaxID=1256513 RepID=A0A918P9R8_9SPHN|nr:N-acetyltransferase [Novosphingobium colocasiae]GGY91158.1 N-acetyltransferase [Novosphingobium colocasiae]
MDLRPARPTDAAALADLGARSFIAKFGDLYSPEDLAGFLRDAHHADTVAHEIANPAYRIMLAMEGDALLGFCKMDMTCGWPDHARGSRVVQLKQLYTEPDATGRGIGAALTEWALAEAAAFGADEVQLSVYSANEGAQRFYHRHGFTKIADIFFMVGSQRDDEFLYARMLG